MFIFSRHLKFLSFALKLPLPLIALCGCTAGFQDCGQYAGTDRYTECLASNGDQEAQYQLGLAAYQAGNTDTAISWLEKSAKPRDNRTPVFIPKGNSGDVRIEMRESGLSKPGHIAAQELLDRINSGN
ncbi:MAG: hypothetical protein H6912_07485 [Kordiimonadaceae bacterium]|nr:hypothetical protein [Kordiimonadaceae bacterium]